VLVAGVGWLRDGAVHGCGAGLLRSELVAFSVAAVQVWLIASLAGCGLCGEVGRRGGCRMGPHPPQKNMMVGCVMSSTFRVVRSVSTFVIQRTIRYQKE